MRGEDLEAVRRVRARTAPVPRLLQRERRRFCDDARDVGGRETDLDEPHSIGALRAVGPHFTRAGVPQPPVVVVLPKPALAQRQRDGPWATNGTRTAVEAAGGAGTGECAWASSPSHRVHHSALGAFQPASKSTGGGGGAIWAN